MATFIFDIMEAQGEVDLATRSDLRELTSRLTSQLKQLRWMMGATLGGVVLILLCLLLPCTYRVL